MAGATWVRTDLHLMLGHAPCEVTAWHQRPSSGIHLSIKVRSEEESAQVMLTFSGTREDLEQLLAQAAEQLTLLPPEPPPATDAEPEPAAGKAGR